MTFFCCSFPSQIGVFTLIWMNIATFRCILYKIALKFFEKKSQEKVPMSSQKVPRSQGKIESPKILGQVPRSGTTGYKHVVPVLVTTSGYTSLPSSQIVVYPILCVFS